MPQIFQCFTYSFINLGRDWQKLHFQIFLAPKMFSESLGERESLSLHCSICGMDIEVGAGGG